MKNLILSKKKHKAALIIIEKNNVSAHNVLTLFYRDAILVFHVDFDRFWLFSMKTDTWP